MVFNIKDFSAHINKFGTLQTNKFAVEIFPPAIFNPLEFERNTMTFRASSARIPSASLDLQRVMRYGVGPEQKFPTNINFTDISITFIDTVENTLWKRFATWINAIFDFTGPSGGSEASYATEYKKNYASHAIKIYVYDAYDTGNATKNTIVLKEAFPVSLSEVGVSWSENNKLYEFTVGFTFREWYYEEYVEPPLRTASPGAELGPRLTTTPVPLRTESPRPSESNESEESE
jgi:hypothetical protein